LIIAVLTSSAASCQTTILPAARTALSMAIHRAFPPKLGEVDPRHLTPAFSTWLFGIGSSIWLTGLVIVSRYGGGDVLAWSVDGVGLMIAYYYGQTGVACAWYYRRHLFKSWKNFIFVGVLPLLGGLILAFIFVWGIKDYAASDYEGASWFGIGPVVWLGIGSLLAGIPLMYSWNAKDHAFFRVKTDPIDRRPPPEGGEPLPPLVPEGAPR
jgi:amino acid transporter